MVHWRGKFRQEKGSDQNMRPDWRGWTRTPSQFKSLSQSLSNLRNILNLNKRHKKSAWCLSVCTNNERARKCGEQLRVFFALCRQLIIFNLTEPLFAVNSCFQQASSSSGLKFYM